MGVEGIGHCRHHNASNEDKDTKWYNAAVARHLRTTSCRRQLDLIDVRDTCCNDDSTVLPSLLPAQPLCRDGCWYPHGIPRHPATPFGMEVIWHGDLAGEEQVSHDGDVRAQSIREQLLQSGAELHSFDRVAFLIADVNS